MKKYKLFLSKQILTVSSLYVKRKEWCMISVYGRLSERPSVSRRTYTGRREVGSTYSNINGTNKKRKKRSRTWRSREHNDKEPLHPHYSDISSISFSCFLHRKSSQHWFHWITFCIVKNNWLVKCHIEYKNCRKKTTKRL